MAELPAVEELAARFSGQLIRPGDTAYEQASRLWNGRIDKYPALIARCRTAQDVVLTVSFARDHNLPVAIRGAHTTAMALPASITAWLLTYPP